MSTKTLTPDEQVQHLRRMGLTDQQARTALGVKAPVAAVATEQQRAVWRKMGLGDREIETAARMATTSPQPSRLVAVLPAAAAEYFDPPPGWVMATIDTTEQRVVGPTETVARAALATFAAQTKAPFTVVVDETGAITKGRISGIASSYYHSIEMNPSAA